MLSNNSLLDLRRRQIDTLKIFNNKYVYSITSKYNISHNNNNNNHFSVTEVKANEEYSVGFRSDKRKMQLNVHLGPNFPNEKPKIEISPRVQHEWIPYSHTGEVQTAPGLLNVDIPASQASSANCLCGYLHFFLLIFRIYYVFQFTVHSDLGRVVHAIIREYEKFPPPSWPSANSDHKPAQKNVHAGNESTIPELCNLSLDELKKLDQNPQYLSDFVDELTVVQRFQCKLDALIEEVKSQAIENLSCEEHLRHVRESVETKLKEFRALSTSYESLSARYQRKTDEFAPQHIKELLQIAALNADGICDTHVEQFLSGKMDVQHFIDKYREAKRISAMRKAKEERLSHQLNEFERATF